MITIFQAFYTGEELILKGRITGKPLVLPKSKNILLTVLHNMAVFFQKGRRHVDIEVRLTEGETQKIESDKLGYFSLRWKGHYPKTVTLVSQDNSEDLRVTPKDFSQHAEMGIISDIDDTIIISHSHVWYKTLSTYITGRPDTREAFPNMAETYQNATQAGYQLFFVSSSKFYLFRLLDAFLKINGFPEALLFLNEHSSRLISWKSLVDYLLKRKEHLHKLHKAEQIAQWFPKMRFVLVGDSGQMDAEIYYRFVIQNPERVLGIYLRDVSDRRHEQIDQLNETLSQKKLPKIQLFKDSREIPLKDMGKPQ